MGGPPASSVRETQRLRSTTSAAPLHHRIDGSSACADLDKVESPVLETGDYRLLKRAGRAGTAHERADCALRDHPSYSRYLRQLASSRRSSAATFWRSIRSLPAVGGHTNSASDAALGYKNLLEAERSFRNLKGTLRIRPVFHRLEERIRAHVLICWLALLLVRIAERETAESWRRLRTELERLKVVTLSGPAGTVCQTTPLSDRQPAILKPLSIAPPHRSPRSPRPIFVRSPWTHGGDSAEALNPALRAGSDRVRVATDCGTRAPWPPGFRRACRRLGRGVGEPARGAALRACLDPRE